MFFERQAQSTLPSPRADVLLQEAGDGGVDDQAIGALDDAIGRAYWIRGEERRRAEMIRWRAYLP